MKNKLIALLLVLIGLSTATSCDKASKGYAVYTLIGNIVNMSGHPVPGIRISIEVSGGSMTAYSNSDGSFEYEWEGSAKLPYTVMVHISDVDGTQNGAYENQSGTVTFTQENNTGFLTNGDCMGYYKTGINVQLEAKPAQ